jgi:hypothetical protein
MEADAIDDDRGRIAEPSPIKVADDDVEPVELRFVVLVGRARVGAEAPMRVDRPDEPAAGRHVAVRQIELDRDARYLLGRHDEVETCVAPDQEDCGLGPVEPVDGPEEADRACHQVGLDLWQRVVEKLPASLRTRQA